MIRNSMRSTRLLSWRRLRWAIAIPTLPVLWWACTSHPLTQPDPAPEQQTDIYISVSPQRKLDLVVMVDNSPSMAPKVDKMNDQFTRLIGALKDPNDGFLPDLRVAVITSDLGTGCRYGSGSCGPKIPPSDGCYGDQGKFQMLKSPTECQFQDGALFLEVKGNQPVNFTGPVDNVNKVFACLASNLGTLGCGIEHQLQAFEFALAAKGVGTEEQQEKFMRHDAYLGLVFLTDEDDCSVATNFGMMGDIPELRGESASLRCATRAHRCGNQNLSDSGAPGYPTKESFTHAFNDCEARVDDPCPNPTDGPDSTDTSQPTQCSPMKSVKSLASHLKARKSDPDNQILVAGIFGWPRSEAELANAEYKIAPVPNPNTFDTLHPTVFDYWPVCYDPDHKPGPKIDQATGFDADAAGWGATGGLRNAAFVDEFGENGLKYSICERDFTEAMSGIGNAIAKKLQNLCVDYKLMDSNVEEDGLQPDCRVVWRRTVPDPNDSTKSKIEEDPQSMPRCAPGATQGNVPDDCWTLVNDEVKCPKTSQLISILRTAQHIQENQQVPAGTKVGMQCRTCTDPIPGQDVNSVAYRACNY